MQLSNGGTTNGSLGGQSWQLVNRQRSGSLQLKMCLHILLEGSIATIWAMLSTSPLGTTTFSDTGVNLLGGEVMCADCVGRVKRMPFTYGPSVWQHGAWGEGSLLGVLSNGQYVSSAGSSGSQQLLNCWTMIGQNILRLALVSRGNLWCCIKLTSLREPWAPCLVLARAGFDRSMEFPQRSIQQQQQQQHIYI